MLPRYHPENLSGGDVSKHEERLARTESIFRDVNERVAETAERFDVEEPEFFCECSDKDCVERVPATLDEYEETRSDGTQFLVLPGHEDPRIESVVEEHGNRFAIVKKMTPTVARIARRLDPRAEPATP
jgi:hypothetical protein